MLTAGIVFAVTLVLSTITYFNAATSDTTGNSGSPLTLLVFGTGTIITMLILLT